MVISTKFTHSDLLAIPDDGKHREIIDGDMFVTPSPDLSHQRISRRLEFTLMKYFEAHPIGEVFDAPLDVILDDINVLEPDLLIVLSEHQEILKDWVRGAPDIVIEILSPTSVGHDRGPKLKAYARFGVREYWIVDREQHAIEVYRLGRSGYQLSRTFHNQDMLTTPLLPGFALEVGTIFQS